MRTCSQANAMDAPHLHDDGRSEDGAADALVGKDRSTVDEELILDRDCVRACMSASAHADAGAQ